MGNPLPEGSGFRVEAISPEETGVDSGPMLFSAQAKHVAETLKDWFGRRLKHNSLTIAKRDGRKTVIAEDVWAALADLDVKEIGAEEDFGDGY